MGIAEIVAGIFKPITDVIDHILPSGDAKLQLQAKVLEGQMAAAGAVTGYMQQLLDAQSKIVLAEIGGQSWLQRNWRPITMLTFLVLVVMDSLNWLPNRLAAQAWTLLQWGIGGYVIGKSAENVMPKVIQAVKANGANQS